MLSRRPVSKTRYHDETELKRQGGSRFYRENGSKSRAETFRPVTANGPPDRLGTRKTPLKWSLSSGKAIECNDFCRASAKQANLWGDMETTRGGLPQSNPSPASRRLKVPPAATTMWSKMSMPMSLATSFNRRVTRMSCSPGVGSPLG